MMKDKATSPSEKIHEYTTTVCDQIAWDKAHAAITQEIESHIIDQRNAYMTDGTDEAAATHKAIMQMGDPVTVGTQLNNTHRPKPQWHMLLLTAALLLIGMAVYLFYMHEAGRRWFAECVVFQSIGLALFGLMYLMDFTWFGRHPKFLYLSLLAFVSVTFVMKQWDILWYSHMAYLSLLFPLGFAGAVYAAKGKGIKGIVVCGLAFFVPGLMLFFMWFRSELMLFAVSAFVIMCIAISKEWFGAKKRHGYMLLLTGTAAILALAAVYFLNSSHAMAYVQDVFNPSYDPLNIDSLSEEIKVTLAGSQFIGRGTMLDGSYYGPGYGISTVLTSAIFYFGWISIIPVLGLLAFFIVKGFRLCAKQRSMLGRFMSVSVMLTLTVMAATYVAYNLGITFYSPFFLPFVTPSNPRSYVITLALSGMMLSVFRTGHVVTDTSVIASPKRHLLRA